MEAMIRLRPADEAEGERSVPELPAISLFSGAGGLDLGAERAGYAIRVSVEHERDAAKTLQANFPHSTILERDIKALPAEEILNAAGLGPGEAELLVGGPPCTPFSKSGYWLEYKRKGLDPEASLLDHYLRVLAETRPRTFLLENVYGLAYRNHNAPWLESLVSAAREIGYHVEFRVLLAADYGVPQRRQRLFVLGSLDGQPTFPEPSHSGPHETRTRYDADLTPHVTAGAAIGDLAGRDELAEEQESVNGKWGHLLPEIPPGDNYLFFTAKRGHPKPIFEWRKRYWSFLLKLDPEQPSPTIQAQPGPYVGPFHWHNRRLRLAEILRLQTFPDGYTVVGSRRSAQVQIGNAVPPQLAEQVSRALAATAGRSARSRRTRRPKRTLPAPA
jgi:DNA (cytosine-5)-methyltransferase 1